MQKIIESPTLTAQFSDVADLLVITIGVKRNDGLHITDGQKDAAMNAAKSVLQIIGAEVETNSTAVLCPVDATQYADVYSSSKVELWGDPINVSTETPSENEVEPTDASSLETENEQDTAPEPEPEEHDEAAPNGELGEPETETETTTEEPEPTTGEPETETIIETEDDAE